MITQAMILNNKYVTKEVTPTFKSHQQVVIVGGGTAGVMTAIKLAQSGIDVLILERLNKLGGTFTNSVSGYYYGAYGGMYETIDREIIQAETWSFLPKTNNPNGFNYIARMFVYEKNLSQKNVEISYQAIVDSVFLSDDSVVGVSYYVNGEQYTVSCDYIVDATADGFLCELAGCDFTMGREFDQKMQPFSNNQTQFNLTTKLLETSNVDSGYINQYDIENYSKNIITSNYGSHLTKNDYCNDEKIIVFNSPILGIREGKCIVGKERLTFSDLIQGKQTEQPLFYSYSHFDNHGKDIAFESQAQNDWTTAMSLWAISMSIGISREHLLPQKHRNLIVSGRHFSRDHDVYSHTRMIRDLQKLAEAVAVIIEIAIKNNNSCLASPSYKVLIDTLAETHCYDNKNDVGVVDVLTHNNRKVQMQLPQTVAEVKKILASDKPGLAILVAYRKELITELIEWLKEKDDKLVFNASVALALLNHDAGIDQLLQAVNNHNPYRPKTSRKYNFPWGVTAIYLLGRLQTVSAIPIISNIFKHHEVLLNDQVEFDDLIMDMNDYRFQYITHAIKALSHIAQHDNALLAEIKETIFTVLNDPNFKLEILMKNSGNLENNTYNMTERVIEYANHLLS